MTGTARGPDHGCDEGGEAPCFAHLLDEPVADDGAAPEAPSLAPHGGSDGDDLRPRG